MLKLLALLPLLLGSAPLADRLSDSRGDLEVRIVGPDERPIDRIKVTARIGLAHYELAPDFDQWLAVHTLEGSSDDTGKVAFENVAAGAHVTLFARAAGLFGMAEGTFVPGTPLEIALQPTGSVRGKVSGKKSHLRAYKIHLVGPRGFESVEGDFDGKGNFEFEDVPAGTVELVLKKGRWTAARQTVKVAPGKKAKAKTLKWSEGFVMGADPLVDVSKVRLVDAAGEPMAGVKVLWSAPWMDGWQPVDDKGELLLAGGNVMIGPPPFVLRLGIVGIEQPRRYLGEVQKVKRGVAIIEAVQEIHETGFVVRRGGKEERNYRLFAVTGDKKTPRIWQGSRTEGVHKMWVPPGPLQLIGTCEDGMRFEVELEKPEGALDEPLVVEVP